MNNKKFIYSGKISLIEPNMSNILLARTFTNGIEAAFCSKPFDTYEQCVKMVSLFLKEILDQVHEQSAESYTNIFEMNRTLIGDSTNSTNTPWGKSEIARIFVVKKEEIGEETLNSPLIVSIFEADANSIPSKNASKTLH